MKNRRLINWPDKKVRSGQLIIEPGEELKMADDKMKHDDANQQAGKQGNKDAKDMGQQMPGRNPGDKSGGHSGGQRSGSNEPGRGSSSGQGGSGQGGRQGNQGDTGQKR